MKREVVIVLLLIICVGVFGQVKFDRNWVFGNNAGIDFSNLSSPLPYRTSLNNLELGASISDSLGELLLYLSCPIDPYDNCSLVNATRDVIANGDSILTYSSNANSTIFIPISGNTTNSLLLFHVGHFNQPSCIFPNNGCVKLYYSEVEIRNGNQLSVTTKNKLLLNLPVEERLAIVRHSNGKDWWLIAHAFGDGSISYPCSDLFIKYLITSDSVQGPFFQNIGTSHCTGNSVSGEMVFSRDGVKLASSLYGDRKIDLFSFDRCEGEIFDFQLVEDVTGGINLMGVLFQVVMSIYIQQQGLICRTVTYCFNMSLM